MNLHNLRRRIGANVFYRVAGPDGAKRHARIHYTEGERWFGDERPIRIVHGDASMYIGGLRALLYQSLHPLAMAGVAGHSGYKGDPWGRLQRTSYFLAITTFGADVDARECIDRIKSVHKRVKGTTADGRTYAASDPHLLKWVHLAEIDSFMRAHQTYGAQHLDADGYDNYVADTAKVAALLGVEDPPITVAQLDQQLAEYRDELMGTDEAREAARFLLLHPPLPVPAKFPYSLLGLAALGMMPRWTRKPLGLPYLSILESSVVCMGGHGVTSLLRWATHTSVLPITGPGGPDEKI